MCISQEKNQCNINNQHAPLKAEALTEFNKAIEAVGDFKKVALYPVYLIELFVSAPRQV
jgi:hypothetical protein